MECGDLTSLGQIACEDTSDDLSCVWETGTCTEYCPTLDETECIADAICTWEADTCVEIVVPVTPPEPPAPEGPVVNQVIEIGTQQEGWEPSKLQTYATKFLIRGKEALTWSLNIEDAGFHNPAIQSSYVKVLTIVNSLFILGLLAIAAMWMFSIVIPRRYLKQVILYFAAAVIFVNFALPLTRLLIDSTNLLQKTLLTQDGESIVIADIVETPTYDEATAYQNTEMVVAEESVKDVAITLTDDSDPTAEEVMIGTIETDEGQVTGLLTGEAGGAITLELPAVIRDIVFNSNQRILITGVSEFHPETEQSIFSFVMIAATGLAYFILALIFVLRIIILWALLILSPILFLLGIFKMTRGWFYNWLTIYGRWLLIGPLVALGLAIIVNIWQFSEGPPIVNPYIGETFASNFTNISFRLPGSNMLNSLSTTGEMMEYFVFLLMLYIPIFFAFGLTRQKILRGTATAVVEKWRERRPVPVISTNTETREKVTEKTETTTGVLGTLKDAFTGQFAKITTTAMPTGMRDTATREAPIIPSAANFLPEQLALTDLRDMMGLLGATKESRKSRDMTIERLANPEILRDPKESVKHSAVRNEIEKRANAGDPEAVVLMNEIKEKETKTESRTESKTESRTEATTSPTISPTISSPTGPTIEKEVREKETVVEKPAKGGEKSEAVEKTTTKTDEKIKTESDDVETSRGASPTEEENDEDDETEEEIEESDVETSRGASQEDNEIDEPNQTNK